MRWLHQLEQAEEESDHLEEENQELKNEFVNVQTRLLHSLEIIKELQQENNDLHEFNDHLKNQLTERSEGLRKLAFKNDYLQTRVNLLIEDVEFLTDTLKSEGYNVTD